MKNIMYYVEFVVTNCSKERPGSIVSTKIWNFVFFCQKTNHGCVFIFLFLLLFFFSRVDGIDPVVLDFCERAHSNGNEKL